MFVNVEKAYDLSTTKAFEYIEHVGHLHVDELRVGVHQHGDDVLVAPVRGPVQQGQAVRISNPGVRNTQAP